MRRTEDGNYLVQGTVRQQVVMGEEEWVVPDLFYRAVGYVTVSLKGGETKVGPFLIEGPETTNIVFKVAEKPSHVDFNKYGEILAHDIVVVE